MNDRFEEFKDAVIRGDVSTPLPKTEENILIDDGHAKLSLFSYEDQGLHGIFGFCLSDDGGFSSVTCTNDVWERMKIKVDAFLAKQEKAKQ